MTKSINHAATKERFIPDKRITPVRWFYGEAGNRLIKGITQYHTGKRRDLAPGERYLGGFIVPAFQRALVWTTEQKSRFIESVYMGMPLGSLVWNQTVYEHPCDEWLLDGQQRMTALCQYIYGEYPVFGWRYPDLPKIEQAHFDRMSIPVIQTNITDEAMCREVYDRLVYGGTPHEPKEHARDSSREHTARFDP